jgi:nucleoside-diphosphate-sugar epimerase
MDYALITGGMGFIGSYIAQCLIDRKSVDKIVLLDHYGRYVDSTREEFIDYRKYRIRNIKNDIIIERGEARYYFILDNILKKYKPKYIFHLAALPMAKIGNLNVQEAFEGTVLSTSILLEIIGKMANENQYRPKKFVYASSSMVYGDFLYSPADEDHLTNPKDPYGTMKLAGENVTRGLSNYFGIKYSIIRPSAVYGPTDMNKRVSQIFIEKAIKNEKIVIEGENEALDFTFVKDVAKGFVLAAENEAAESEVFNITHGKAHTLLEYVLILKRYFKNLQYEIVERDSFRPKRGTLSIEKARNLLGYEPEYDLEKGIAEYYDFLKAINFC